MNIHSPFILPEVEFVGGATQELVFHCYHKVNKKPADLSPYVADFSVISYVNKFGTPLITKSMNVRQDTDVENGICNILSVVLNPVDTKDLRGKYIYQISVKDVADLVEIPGQGLLHITNNINKKFLS